MTCLLRVKTCIVLNFEKDAPILLLISMSLYINIEQSIEYRGHFIKELNYLFQ